MADPRLAGVAQSVLRELCERFPIGYEPRLVWKGLRVTAGVAYYRVGTITLSTRVLKDPESVQITLTHEYAHLLAYYRHGARGSGHGKAWQQAMLDLGLTPVVRHCYSVERNRPRQRVTYRCLKCGRKIERARRLPRLRRYVHADCGGDLRLVGIERVTHDDSMP